MKWMRFSSSQPNYQMQHSLAHSSYEIDHLICNIFFVSILFTNSFQSFAATYLKPVAFWKMQQQSPISNKIYEYFCNEDKSIGHRWQEIVNLVSWHRTYVLLSYIPSCNTSDICRMQNVDRNWNIFYLFRFFFFSNLIIIFLFIFTFLRKHWVF